MIRASVPFIRRSALVLGAVGVVACVNRATSISPVEFDVVDDPPLACTQSDTGFHRLTQRAAEGEPSRATVRGSLRDRRQPPMPRFGVVMIRPLPMGVPKAAGIDSAGTFEIAGVAPGRYELYASSTGFRPSRDTIDVPATGLTVELEQVRVTYPTEKAVCDYLAAIDSQPLLALRRPETTSVMRDLPRGGTVRVAVLARPNADGATFVLSIENVGSDPVHLFRLCYPILEGKPVREYRDPDDVSLSCYGGGGTLAPGAAMFEQYSVQLRGRPGRYLFRFHAAEPASLDGLIRVELVAGRPSRLAK